MLNSADVHLYNNTFVDAPASFERNERSKTNDHFRWHPATGPDVDEREGHVFVNNLLVAGASHTQPLLRFEQPQALCETLTRPMANEVNGNVYVRARPGGSAAELPLIVISPVANESCHATFTSRDGLRKAVPVPRYSRIMYAKHSAGTHRSLWPPEGASEHTVDIQAFPAYGNWAARCARQYQSLPRASRPAGTG